MFSVTVAQQEAHDWAALHHTVVTSVAQAIPNGLVAKLRDIHNEFVDTVPGHPEQGAVLNFAFFTELRNATQGYSIQLGATAAAYRLRLAEKTLPLIPAAASDLQTGIIAALTDESSDYAHEAFTSWLTIQTGANAALAA